MIELRPYQTQIIDQLRKNWLRGIFSQLVQLATGGGKTIIFTWMATEAVKNGKKVIIFCDRQELLSQAGKKIGSFSHIPYFIEAGNNHIPDGYRIYVAMSETVKRRLDKPYFRQMMETVDFVIIDECHHQNFNRLFESGILDKKFVLGFTATPERSGKMRQLGMDYKIMVRGIDRRELIKTGFLVPDRYYSVKSDVNLDKIGRNTATGDYNENELYGRYDRTELYAGVIENWKKISLGKCTLVFCVNISHCIKTCIEFNNSGIKAKFLVSSVGIPKHPGLDAKPADLTRYELQQEKYELYKKYFLEYSGERETVLGQWERGDFPVMINAGILTTGYDNPGIECIVLNRATLSRILLLQMIGRGARPNQGKDGFDLLDFGDNCKRLNTYYTGEENWSLIHKQGNGGGEVPMKECKNCEAIIFAGAKICDICGAVVVDEKKLKKVELELVNYSGLSTKELNLVMSNKKNLKDFDMWEKIAADREYKKGWVYRQIMLRGGIELLREYGQYKGYHRDWADRQGGMMVMKEVAV